MRLYTKNSFTLMLIFGLFLSTVVGYTNTPPNMPKPIKPDFENVDVFIECDWGANENMVQAKVFDKTKAENPYLLIINNNGTNDEVLLIKGIIVRIFNHESGKLLKTYIGA